MVLLLSLAAVGRRWYVIPGTGKVTSACARASALLLRWQPDGGQHGGESRPDLEPKAPVAFPATAATSNAPAASP